MKIATLYRKDGKVILETDNDAIAQVATDSPQDVVVMDACERTDARQAGRPPTLAAPYGQDVPPQGIAALRRIATELRTRHVAGCKGPSPTLVAFADRIDAAIDAAKGGAAMTAPTIPADQWPDTVVAKLWASTGERWDLAPFAGGWALGDSSTPMPAGHDWRVPAMRSQPAPAIDLGQYAVAVQYAINGLLESGCKTDSVVAKKLRSLRALIDGQVRRD